MISFSYWYMISREGICLVFVSGVTAIATWSHKGEICLADKSGAIEPTCCYQSDLGGGKPPCRRQYCQYAERHPPPSPEAFLPAVPLDGLVCGP